MNLSLQSTACAVRFLYLVQLDSRLGSPRNRVDCGVHSDPGRAVKRVLVHLMKGPIHHSGKHALKIDAPLAMEVSKPLIFPSAADEQVAP
jgi:hypothetical protein